MSYLGSTNRETTGSFACALLLPFNKAAQIQELQRRITQSKEYFSDGILILPSFPGLPAFSWRCWRANIMSCLLCTALHRPCTLKGVYFAFIAVAVNSRAGCSWHWEQDEDFMGEKRNQRLQIHCREKTDWLLSFPRAHLGKYVIWSCEQIVTFPDKSVFCVNTFTVAMYKNNTFNPKSNKNRHPRTFGTC